MSEYLVDNELDGDAIIKVVGVGGGGGNAVDYMLDKKINGVQFININTDAQALRKSKVDNKLRIGENVTRGLGAGSNPSVGAQVAEAEKDKIEQEIAGADMIFIAAGMGGGTGTGAAPVVAEIAEKLNILTVAVVTKPFFFEGPKREKYAVQGIERLSEHVDSLIVVPNDKLLETGEAQGGSLLDGFACANNVLYGAVQGIAELITCPGMMNVDFADVKTVMSDAGVSMMGTGEASGENRAEEATMNAINSPLLEDVELTGAKGVLVNITCSSNLKIAEFRTIGQIVTERASEDATVKVGTVFDDSLGDEMIVTVVATGLESNTAAPATKNIIQEHAPVNIEQEAKKKKDRPFFLRGFTDK